MAKRPTTYSVGGNARPLLFKLEQWKVLEAALPYFAGGFVHPPEYACGLRGIQEEQTFSVWRKDHKPLVKDEVLALSWFFRGVMATHGMLNSFDEKV